MRKLFLAVILIAAPIHPEPKPPAPKSVTRDPRPERKVSAILNRADFDARYDSDEEDYPSTDDMEEPMN